MLLYIMKMMEYFRCKPFVLLYANSGVTEDNQPDQAFVQEVFDLFAARFDLNEFVSCLC